MRYLGFRVKYAIGKTTGAQHFICISINHVSFSDAKLVLEPI